MKPEKPRRPPSEGELYAMRTVTNSAGSLGGQNATTCWLYSVQRRGNEFGGLLREEGDFTSTILGTWIKPSRSIEISCSRSGMLESLRTMSKC